MEISERELHHMVREVDDQHRAGLQKMGSDIRELHSATRSSRLSRRSLLTKAGVGGFALTVGNTVLPASSLLPRAFGQAAQGLTDGDIAAFAESVELTAVEVYKAAGASGKVKNKAVTDAAAVFAGHHVEHAKAFAGASGGKATGRPNQKLLDTISGQLKSATDEKAVLTLAIDLENAAAGTYLFALGALQSPQALALTASILPVESQHATTLAAVLGKQGKDLVPPFETKDKALDPAVFPVE